MRRVRRAPEGKKGMRGRLIDFESTREVGVWGVKFPMTLSRVLGAKYYLGFFLLFWR